MKWICTGNYTVREVLMKNSHSRYFAKHACKFSLILLEPCNFLYKSKSIVNLYEFYNPCYGCRALLASLPFQYVSTKQNFKSHKYCSSLTQCFYILHSHVHMTLSQHLSLDPKFIKETSPHANLLPTSPFVLPMSL